MRGRIDEMSSNRSRLLLSFNLRIWWGFKGNARRSNVVRRHETRMSRAQELTPCCRRVACRNDGNSRSLQAQLAMLPLDTKRLPQSLTINMLCCGA